MRWNSRRRQADRQIRQLEQSKRDKAKMQGKEEPDLPILQPTSQTAWPISQWPVRNQIVVASGTRSQRDDWHQKYQNAIQQQMLSTIRSYLWSEGGHMKIKDGGEVEEPIRAWKEARWYPETDNEGYSIRPGFRGMVHGRYGLVDTAECVVGAYDNHKAPDLNCGCGFYARKWLNMNQNWPHGAGALYSPNSWLLEVELYGVVHEFSEGYRAEKQRIIAAYAMKPQPEMPQCEAHIILIENLGEGSLSSVPTGMVTYDAQGKRHEGTYVRARVHPVDPVTIREAADPSALMKVAYDIVEPCMDHATHVLADTRKMCHRHAATSGVPYVWMRYPEPAKPETYGLEFHWLDAQTKKRLAERYGQ